MIIGLFDEDSRPYVDGRVFIPRLQAETTIRFQVDTGSDIMLIHPPDLRRAGISTELLNARSETGAIGGLTETFIEPAVVHFVDEDGLTRYDFRFNIHIAEPDAHNDDYPSLLGMDILNCWYTECDLTNDMHRFTVRRTL